MRSIAIVVATALGLVLLTLAGLGALLFRGGISARTEPSAMETVLALRLRRFALRASREKVNPTAASSEVLAAGRSHFADHCASCHGNDGSGKTELGRNLYPHAPDMRLASTQQLTDGELFTIIEEGVRLTGMPAWGDQSEQSQRASWQLVRFIRHLPGLTAEERLEMDSLNPKAPEDRQEEHEEENFLNGPEAIPARKSHQH